MDASKSRVPRRRTVPPTMTIALFFSLLVRSALAFAPAARRPSGGLLEQPPMSVTPGGRQIPDLSRSTVAERCRPAWNLDASANDAAADADTDSMSKGSATALTAVALPASPKSTEVNAAAGADTPSPSLPSPKTPSAAADDEILPPPSSSTTFMITREMRRVLIEELRYTRAEVDAMRVELAGPVVEKRVSRPPEGMPESWYREEEPEEDGGMLGRLERESRYPLKGPLLAISLILGGKGLGDAIITLIKVNTGFPGASLSEEFMGVNVLGIDVLCVLAGIALGSWTWKTMKD